MSFKNEQEEQRLAKYGLFAIFALIGSMVAASVIAGV